MKYAHKLILSVAVCLSAGLTGSLFTSSAIPTWYAGLEKPSFTPPDWLFAPAWTTLYVLMGISASLVWRRGLGEPRVRTALAIFLAQLVLNVLWSAAFFGLESPLLGIVVIVMLWVAILLTMVRFSGISRAAGFIMLPYIGWVTYAAILNIAIFALNR